MCIVSNWVNEAQDLMAVTKYDDLPNSLIPSEDPRPGFQVQRFTCTTMCHIWGQRHLLETYQTLLKLFLIW